MSRLPTFSPTEAEVDLEIPGFTLLGKGVPVPVDRFDVASWSGIDDELSCCEAGDSNCAIEAVESSPVFIEDIRLLQAKDTFCVQIRTETDLGKDRRFAEDDRGVLIRTAPRTRRIRLSYPNRSARRCCY